MDGEMDNECTDGMMRTTLSHMIIADDHMFINIHLPFQHQPLCH